jgi:hypothetical protein
MAPRHPEPPLLRRQQNLDWGEARPGYLGGRFARTLPRLTGISKPCTLSRANELLALRVLIHTRHLCIASKG